MLKILFLAALLPSICLAHIFDEDSRTETQHPSIAAMIPVNAFRGNIIQGDTWKDRMKLCDGERFGLQPSIATCTAFLIAEDILMTAGHCFRQTTDCKNFKWVFGFSSRSAFDKGNFLSAKPDDIVSCKEVITSHTDMVSGLDYMLIRLNKKVDRPALKLSSKVVAKGDNLSMVGFPSGLPMKQANGKTQFKQGDGFFQNSISTDLDVFEGNSGGPVFNEEGEVMGIVSSTEWESYTLNGNCRKPVVKKSPEGRMGWAEISLMNRVLLHMPAEMRRSFSTKVPPEVKTKH
jgi:hypothetical protein